MQPKIDLTALTVDLRAHGFRGEVEADPALSVIAMTSDALSLICPKKRAQKEAERLIADGASTVTIASVEYVFEARNALYDSLEARLG